MARSTRRGSTNGRHRRRCARPPPSQSRGDGAGQPGGPAPDEACVPAGVAGGNCGMWRSVATELGWNEAFTFGGSDIEFSWRAQLAGYRVAWAPAAVVAVREPTSIRVVARQWYRYGVSDPQLFQAFRPDGMRRSSIRQAARVCGPGWPSMSVISGVRSTRNGDGYAWRRTAGRMAGSVRARGLCSCERPNSPGKADRRARAVHDIRLSRRPSSLHRAVHPRARGPRNRRVRRRQRRASVVAHGSTRPQVDRPSSPSSPPRGKSIGFASCRSCSPRCAAPSGITPRRYGSSCSRSGAVTAFTANFSRGCTCSRRCCRSHTTSCTSGGSPRPPSGSTSCRRSIGPSS